MSNARSRPPLLGRLLLRLRPLGEHRADLQADLDDLFAARLAERGIRYARRRYLVDVLSLWFHRQPATEGVVLALLASPVIGWALYARVSARDPLAFAAATAILLVAATAGVLIPARRASRVDPSAVLKEQ